MGLKIRFLNELRLSLIDIEGNFPMRSSEFTESLYFGRNYKTTAIKNKK